MTEVWKPDRQLLILQHLLSVPTAFCFAYTLGSLRRGGVHLVTSLLVTLLFAVASLLVFISRLRGEARRTGEPWHRTTAFGGAAAWWGIMAAFICCMICVFLFARQLAWFGNPARLVAILLSCVLMGLIGARIIITNRLLRQGRDLPTGDRAVSGIYAWSGRVFGVWWAAEVAIMAAMCIIFISLLPGRTFDWLIYPLLLSGQRLYVFIAHYRGLRWPNRDGMRKAAARRRELEGSPGYEALRGRNEWVELGAVAALFVGIGLAMVPVWPLHLYDNQDPQILWVIGLMFGLIGTAPAIFVSLATLPRGRARWVDFCTYWSAKYDDAGFKRTGGVVLAFALLTLVSLVGMAASLRAHS